MKARLPAAVALLTLAAGFAATREPDQVWDKLDVPRLYPDRTTPAAGNGSFTIIYTSRVEGLAPTVWTGDNVRVNYGHSPLQRAPMLPSLPLDTNRPPHTAATQQMIRLKPEPP